MKKDRLSLWCVCSILSCVLLACGDDGDKSCDVADPNSCGKGYVCKLDSSMKYACVEINPSHCTNKAKDGDETDVDCGGSCGATCDLGKACNSKSDCATGACDEKTKKCAAVSCKQDSDCSALASGHCNTESEICFSCADKIKNGSESDVDCGGACGATCENGKACTAASDCKNGQCVDNKCAGEKAQDAKLDKLFINEVMSYPAKNTKFETSSKSNQCDFVEIVNKLDQAQSLDGLTLKMLRTDDGKNTEIATPLSGTMPAKGAAVVIGNNCDLDAPEGVLVIRETTVSDGNFLTSTASYTMTITNGTESTKEAFITKMASGKSLNREADRDESKDFVSHEDVSTRGLKHSPGYCANGGLFTENCADPCSDGKLSAGEADVDCGGICAAKCESGKKCAGDKDCATNSCNEGVCAEITCTTDEDCKDDALACDTEKKTCGIKPTCSDGIKNGKETDKDCGGPACGKCQIGAVCKEASDCETNECTGGLCTGEKPQDAKVSDLYINEVMSYPTKNTKFDIPSQSVQCDFVEIVNKLDQNLSLDGLTLKMLRTDDGKNTEIATPLSGTMPAKGAAVVIGNNCELDAPKDVIVIRETTVSDGNFLVSTGSYTMTITKGTESSKEAKVTKMASGKSFNRGTDRDESADFVLHEEVSTTGLKHSPGYCANGGLFSEDCADKCSDGALSTGEADVDCGGVCAAKCENGKKCNNDKDCVSLNCSDGVCAEAKCTKNEDCADDTLMCDENGVCVPKPTCEDNVKNQDETDVDCGGALCGKCDEDKACNENSDCKSGKCESNVCKPDTCAKPQAGELVINEVLNDVDTKANFEFIDLPQFEFIEIYNTTDKEISLNGLKISINRQDSSSGSFDAALSGCLAGKGYGVIANTGNAPQKTIAENAYFIGITAMKKADALVNGGDYKFVLTDGTNDIHKLHIPKPAKARKGISDVYDASSTADGEGFYKAILHTDKNAGVKNSVGRDNMTAQ